MNTLMMIHFIFVILKISGFDSIVNDYNMAKGIEKHGVSNVRSSTLLQ